MKTTPALILSGALAIGAFGSAGAQSIEDEGDAQFGIQAASTIVVQPPQVIVGTLEQDAEPPRIAASGRDVYIVWHEFPLQAVPVGVDQQPEVFLSRSTNRGGSFGVRINISQSPDIDSRDEAIAVSGDDVFIAWSENLDQVLFRRSTNRGSSFGSVKKLSLSPGAVHPQLAAHGEEVFAVWEAIGQLDEKDIFFARSLDGGRQFSTEINLSNTDGTSEFPQLAVSDGRVVVTWRDQGPAGGDFEIQFTQIR